MVSEVEPLPGELWPTSSLAGLTCFESAIISGPSRLMLDPSNYFTIN